MKFAATILLFLFLSFTTYISAQGTLADYERAQGLLTRFQTAAIDLPGATNWIGGTNHFWYRRSVKGGGEFVWVDADGPTRRLAFDHERLAVAFSAASGEKYTSLGLRLGNLTFLDAEQIIEFVANESRWKCDLSSYKCDRLGPANTQGFNTPPQLRTPVTQPSEQSRLSPDGLWEAVVKNYNIVVCSKDKKVELALSFDGSENNSYERNSIAWSPDSKKLAAYRVRPGV